MDRKMLQTPMMFPDVVSGLLWLPPDSSSSANEYLSLSFMMVQGMIWTKQLERVRLMFRSFRFVKKHKQ